MHNNDQYMANDDVLQEYIRSVKKIGVEEYQTIARLFQEVVKKDVVFIWQQHKNKLLMEIQKIKLCTKNSTVNSSTAIGYILEEFIVKQLPPYYCKMIGSTTNAAADFFWKDKSKIELYVNLKADKGGSGNKAVCAANKLINLYKENENPKLMLVFKVIYSIDEENSTINIENFSTVFLESFILEYRIKLSKDKRNWSAEYKPESGRLQIPTHKMNAPIKDIPAPAVINKFVSEELPMILRNS